MLGTHAIQRVIQQPHYPSTSTLFLKFYLFIFLAVPCGMWDLSSLSRDRNTVVKGYSLNHWTTKFLSSLLGNLPQYGSLSPEAYTTRPFLDCEDLGDDQENRETVRVRSHGLITDESVRASCPVMSKAAVWPAAWLLLPSPLMHLCSLAVFQAGPCSSALIPGSSPQVEDNQTQIRCLPLTTGEINILFTLFSLLKPLPSSCDELSKHSSHRRS